MKTIYDSNNLKSFDVPDYIEEEIISIQVLAGLFGLQHGISVEGHKKSDRSLTIMVKDYSGRNCVLRFSTKNNELVASFFKGHKIGFIDLSITGLNESIAAMKEEIK